MDWLVWLVGAVVTALLAVVVYAETRRPTPLPPVRRPAPPKVASVEPDLHEVAPMPFGMYVGRDPIAELRELAPQARIIEVHLP